MPDLYREGEYDLAGFCVGVVDQDQLIDGHAITPGDKVIGIASSGVHSNGFSLVRKIVFDVAGLTPDSMVADSKQSVADTLIEPTVIYTKATRQILSHYKVKNVVHGIAHITGGGLEENLERVTPAGLDIEIDGSIWERPMVFPLSLIHI